MESLLVLVALLAIMAFVIFPIWVIVRIGTLSRELGETRELLERSLGGHGAVAPEPKAEQTTPAPAQPSPVPAAAAPTTAAPPPIAFAEPPQPEMPPPFEPSVAATQPPPLAPAEAQPAPASPPPLLTAPADTQPAQKHSFNWEVLFGTKFLAWFGGVAAFLAVAFFLKYSFEHGWISPMVRASMGFLFGAGLVAGGLFAIRNKYDIIGHTLCACGIVSLYSVTFACRAVYHFSFFGLVPTFALMSLITLAAFVLAVSLDGKWVAILGILGGFLTPVLLSTGVDNPPGLFAYIALLDIGLYAVAVRKRWNFLVPLGALGTALLQIGWAVRFLGYAHDVYEAMVVCLVFDALFLAGLLLARRMKIDKSPHSYSVLALALVSFCFGLYLAGKTMAGWQPWWLFGFVFLADACVLAVAGLEKRADVSASLPVISGFVVFVILGVWSANCVTAQSGLLTWALVVYFVFAVLHTAVPLILGRVKGTRENAGMGLQFFAPLALILVLVPMMKHAAMPFIVWPAILLIDLLAIVLAALTRSIVGVVLSLVLTLAAAALWIFKVPVSLPQVPAPMLLVIGGFAVLFFAASLWLGRRIAARAPDGAAAAHFSTTLPALSSLLPFVLIVMMVARLSLANPTPVFGLVLLLLALTLGLAKMLRHEWLPACALAGALAVCWAWFSGTGCTGQPAPVIALGWFAGLWAIFTVFAFVFRSEFLNTRGPWIVSAAAGPLFFPLIYRVIKTAWPNDFMGLVPAVFALPALLCLVAVLRLDAPENPRRLGRLALYGGAALLFITLVFPIQFSRQWITIGWALEGAALLWLYTRVPHRGLPWAGAALLGAAFVRLAFNPAVLSYHVAGGTAILNWFLYTYGIAAACMFAGAGFLKNTRPHRLGAPLQKTLPVLGVVLLFLLLNIEIADFFTPSGSRMITLEFSRNFARDMTYTIAWSLFALALLIAGIWKKLPAARYAALGLLAIVAAKLLLHDLATLDTLYRVAALFGVAVIMIIASFLYQKYLTPKK